LLYKILGIRNVPGLNFTILHQSVQTVDFEFSISHFHLPL